MSNIGPSNWGVTTSSTVTTTFNTTGTTVTGLTPGVLHYTMTVSSNTVPWYSAPKRVRGGKYQVRCRGCSRWAKVLEEKPGPRWTVHCERCLGENEGFAA